MAIVNFIGIPVMLEYVDSTTFKMVPKKVKLPESAKEEDIYVRLLYVPGHYEILYKWFDIKFKVQP